MKHCFSQFKITILLDCTFNEFTSFPNIFGKTVDFQIQKRLAWLGKMIYKFKCGKLYLVNLIALNFTNLKLLFGKICCYIC